MKNKFILAVIALMLLLLPSIGLTAVDPNIYIPNKAYKFIPTIRQEQSNIFPDIPFPSYIPALIEQESCITLTHSKCWDPTSELKTSREQGVGWFQITRAYTSNGSIRFDTLNDLRKKHPVELYELNWTNIKERPDLQVKAGLYLIKENWDALSDVPDFYNRLAMADSAYNGGIVNLKKSRNVCALTKDCDPNIWFGNVEIYLIHSTKILYDQRSAKSINQEHVRSTLKIRLFKYRNATY